ncbi:hypothetical protein [Polaromonas sp.]|uniref:hypothetical protein n=1 Tax=Polaromonas sp. TaxID=1869339 RepID=UPI0032660B06
MARYHIDSVHLKDGLVDEVSMTDLEELQDMARRTRTAPVAEVVALIKTGQEVVGSWINLQTADGQNNGMGTIPLQVVVLPDGSESIDVVQRGQPEAYRSILSLGVYDEHFTAPGYAQKWGAL